MQSIENQTNQTNPSQYKRLFFSSFVGIFEISSQDSAAINFKPNQSL